MLKAESAEHGIRPGVAARLHTESGGDVFKADPNDSPAGHLYARERAANLILPDGVPSPRMLWSGETGSWILVMFTFIEGAPLAGVP